MDQTTAIVSPNLPDISKEITEAIEKEISFYPQTQNWASNLGHPCMRFCVHSRLDWDKKPKPTAQRQMIFNGGNVIEQHISKVYLEKAGYVIEENNTPIQKDDSSGMFKKFQIGGRLDFLCRSKDGKLRFPVEAKSMAQWDWDKINCIEDLLFSKKHWHQQYPAQLVLYMLAKGFEYGAFLLINKQNFQPKHIWVHLDYTYAEDLIKKAEMINALVAKEEYPSRIEFSESTCGRCDFATICLPDIKRDAIDLVDKPEFDTKLLRRAELKAAHDEYKDLDEDVKGEAKSVGHDFITGHFMVQIKKQERTSYEVPDEIKKQHAVKNTILLPKFIPLDGKVVA